MASAVRYLLVLYMEGGDDQPVSPGRLAERLDRSPAATTEMLQRLEADGLVVHEPYEGATLTDDGRETAEESYDTYRTLSQFFREVLGLEDHEAEAMRLAGSVSPLVAERLAATLLGDTENPEPLATATESGER
ncbi:MAG: metal-dependent transcriptional regulator [Natronomonas sp.]